MLLILKFRFYLCIFYLIIFNSSNLKLLESSDLKYIVLKFGGTSVKDAEAMLRVVKISTLEVGNKVVVTSACSGITDKLISIANFCSNGNSISAKKVFSEIHDHHYNLMNDLNPNELISPKSDLVNLLDELSNLIDGVILLGELTDRTRDYFASFGERLSSLLLKTAFEINGIRAALLDSRKVIVTDHNFTNAKPLFNKIIESTKKELTPLLRDYEIVVTQGFIGMTEDGVTTTIGRGGSDHTGALLGAAISAKEIQIWTDVSGILTSDPRIIPNAKVVPEVTFSEARQLSYFGAKVIHPETIVPAVEMNIPVIVKNSLHPEDPGTRILPDNSIIKAGVHAISIKKDLVLIKILNNENFNNFNSIFIENNVNIECSVNAENRSIIAINSSSFSDVLYSSLKDKYKIEIIKDVALICLCGADLSEHHGSIAEAISSIKDSKIYLIASGFSNNAVLIGVKQIEANSILTLIHSQLFE